MKIAANPLPFLDVAPAPSATGSNADYGRSFESTIRDVAKDSSADTKPRNENGSAAQENADQQPSAYKPAPSSKASDKPSDAKAVKNKDGDDKPAAKDADQQGDETAGDSLAFLGRLLGGTAAPVAATETVDAESQKSTGERVIVVSLEAGAADEAVEDASGAGARGKVKLDVVHMETHFEPRSDAFVLVEGKDSRAAGTAEEDGAPLSFDQALARLSARKAGGTLATAEEPKTSSGELTQAKTEAAIAHDATAQERVKERGRSKVAADLSARDTDMQSDEAELQAAVVTRKRDAKDASTDKVTAQLGRVASDAADTGKSGLPAAKDGAGVLPLASMTGQVAGRVIDALGSTLASQRPSDLPSEAYLRMTAGGAALKTLTIQLQPETLGKLDVSMRLVDGQLTLEIAATEAETAKVLAQDREGLRKLLQHAGFSVDDASISIVTRDNSAQPQVRAAAASDTAGAQQDSSNAGSGNARDRGGDAEPRRQSAGRDERPQSNESRRAARSIDNYI